MGSQFFSHSPVKMIKQCAVVIALFAVLAEGQRRGGRRQAPRRGRQDAAGGYEAPGDVAEYAASDAVATYDAAGAECPEKTTLSMLRFLNLDLSVMVKLMEVTMLTL